MMLVFFFMPENEKIEGPVILFDGVCNLCSGAVQFVIKRDKKNIFRFASLQSSFGQRVLQNCHLSTGNFTSFVLLQNGRVYVKSAAALLVARQLSGFWPLLYAFIIIPSFLRNIVYNVIAANRYKWFGQKEACWIPSPELKIRFFD